MKEGFPPPYEGLFSLGLGFFAPLHPSLTFSFMCSSSFDLFAMKTCLDFCWPGRLAWKKCSLLGLLLTSLTYVDYLLPFLIIHVDCHLRLGWDPMHNFGYSLNRSPLWARVTKVFVVNLGMGSLAQKKMGWVGLGQEDDLGRMPRSDLLKPYFVIPGFLKWLKKSPIILQGCPYIGVSILTLPYKPWTPLVVTRFL